MDNTELSAEEIAERKAYRERLLSIGYMKGGRKRPKVKEYRRDDGTRVKSTTDELGNTVTEHANKDDRVDVTVRPQIVEGKFK